MIEMKLPVCRPGLFRTPKNVYLMKTKALRLTLLFALMQGMITSLTGQEILPALEVEDSVVNVPDTIQKLILEPTQITEAFQESNSLLLESGRKHLSEEDLTRYNKEVDTLFSAIQHFMGDPSVISVRGASLRELDLITQQSEYYLGEIDKLQKRLSGLARGLNNTTQLLDANREEWESILTGEGAEAIPDDRLERIQRTIHRLDSTGILLQEDLAEILVLEDRLSDKVNEFGQLQVWIGEQRTLIGERFFTRELPGLIGGKRASVEQSLVQKHLSQIRKALKSDFDIVRTKFRKQLTMMLILLILLLGIAVWYRKNYAQLISEKYELSETQIALIHSPVVTVLFIVGLLIRFSLPHLPHTFRSLNLMVMMIPMAIIVVRLIGLRIRNWIILLSVLCGLTFFYELTFDPDILLRMVILVFSISAIALFVWLLVKRPFTTLPDQKMIYRVLRIMFMVFIILLSIAVAANFAGAFSLAEFFTLVPIQIALLAFGIEVATTLLDTLIYLILASKYMQRVNIIKDDFDYIYRKARLLANLFLWGLFFVIALYVFRIREVVFEWVEGLVTNGIKIGAVEITVGSILIFLFVIWASIVITRITRNVLEKEVFPRVKTRKGVPSTVVMFLRIILISGGFLLAAAAAGIKLTNLSIVLGAFSVGIGFGLQNIFNNMVSGIILALERPIKVGDVVQVGELLGTVLSIGLRSSNVKSFDGAEVIVPNGNLISSEMINWTRSDSNRRMDIRVGVAYGSDTDAVIDILQEVARNIPQVHLIPGPTAYFIGFGESSLDFRLLAWTHIDHRLSVESELHGAINKALKKAGFEIPFPQRDLHFKNGESTPVDPHIRNGNKPLKDNAPDAPEA